MSAENDILAINNAKNAGMIEIDTHTGGKTVELTNFTNSKKTELEAKTVEEIAKISSTGIDTKQDKTDDTLKTTDKNVARAINENYEQIQNCLVGVVITQSEYDLLGDIVNTNGIIYIIQG